MDYEISINVPPAPSPTVTLTIPFKLANALSCHLGHMPYSEKGHWHQHMFDILREVRESDLYEPMTPAEVKKLCLE